MTIQTPIKHGLMIEGRLVNDVKKLKSDLVDLAGDDQKESIYGRLAGQIMVAMQAQTQPVEFPTLQDFWENLLFRLGALASMAALTSGVYDGDYYDPELGPKPRLGTTDSSRVSKYWEFIGPGTKDAAWQQAQGADSLAAIRPLDGHSLPFRGECAGAFQLTVFWGLLNGLGATTFSELAAKFGTMLVGPWTDNPATDFMAQSAPVEDPPIPGDYMYFKNKDDYLTYAPDGFWQGLNAMYMGEDMLGTRHYSGMGATWLSEQNLRASLVNAYYHDCYPHEIKHPDVDVRFTIRRLLQVPATITMPVMQLRPSKPSKGAVPTTATLRENGYQAIERDTYENLRTTVEECAELFKFNALELHQHHSSSLENPTMRFDAPGASIVLDYLNADDDRHAPDSLVRVIVKLKSAVKVR